MAPPSAPLLLVAVTAVLVCSAAAAPTGTELTQDQLQKLFEQNFKRFKAFKCRTPQKRSVMVGGLLTHEGRLLPSQTVTPSATVLHVCGPSTGCCFTADQVCAPADMQNVTLPFQVRDAVNKDAITTMLLTFINHTRCACVPKSSTSGNHEAIILL